MDVERTDRASAVAMPLVAGVAGVAALAHVARPDGLTGEISYLVALGLASVLAWLGVAGRDGAGRRPWVWIAAGVTLSFAADLSSIAMRWTMGSQPDVSGADVLWLASYAALAAGIIRLSPSPSGVDVDAILDCLVGAVVALLILWELTLAEMVGDDSIGWLARAVWAAYPILDVVLLSLLIRALILHRGSRSTCV
ncbi:MAG TPA: hypothetical protein VF228_19255, partial [Iamia sp.]